MKKILITLSLFLVAIPAYAISWDTLGNTSLNSSSFIGTTDYQDVIFKRNNQEVIRLVANSLTNPALQFSSNTVAILQDKTATAFLSHYIQTGATSLFGDNLQKILTLDSTGISTTGGNFSIKSGKELRIYAIGNVYQAFKVGNISQNTTWTLPTTDSNGVQALVSNGTGQLSWKTIQSPSSPSVVTVNTEYDMSPNDTYIIANNGTAKIHLLDAPTFTGKEIKILNASVDSIDLLPAGAEQIGLVNMVSPYTLQSDESVTLVSDGNNWRVMK